MHVQRIYLSDDSATFFSKASNAFRAAIPRVPLRSRASLSSSKSSFFKRSCWTCRRARRAERGESEFSMAFDNTEGHQLSVFDLNLYSYRQSLVVSRFVTLLCQLQLLRRTIVLQRLEESLLYRHQSVHPSQSVARWRFLSGRVFQESVSPQLLSG